MYEQPAGRVNGTVHGISVEPGLKSVAMTIVPSPEANLVSAETRKSMSSIEAGRSAPQPLAETFRLVTLPAVTFGAGVAIESPPMAK
jgi:hypothetical protein